MIFGSSPGLDVTLVQVGKQAPYISLFLTAFVSSILSLFTAHEPLYFSLSLPFLHYIFAHHNDTLAVELGGPVDVFSQRRL